MRLILYIIILLAIIFLTVACSKKITKPKFSNHEKVLLHA
jgi:hypothetical protein